MDLSFEHYCETLCLLAEPPSQGCDLSNPQTSFEINIKNACKKLSIEELSQLHPLRNYGIKTEDGCDIRWRWVTLALHIFLSMKEYNNKEEPLLSVRQEKAICTTLEFVISLGLLPSLLPGVGIPIEKRCSAATAQWVLQGVSSEERNPVSIIELYDRLSAVTKILLSLINTGYFRGLLLSQHLSDILAALCQLSMAPLKKPRSNTSKETSNGNGDGDKCEVLSLTKNMRELTDENEIPKIFTKAREEVKKKPLVIEIEEKSKYYSNLVPNSDFQMTTELWNRLQVERKYFSRALENLVKDTHQPLVVRDLLLLQGSPDKMGEKGKPAPIWLRRGCASILNACLFRKGGVVATVHAICDVFSIPQPKTDMWAQHMVLGKLVSMALNSKKDNPEWCESICSQIIELLSADNIKNCQDYARAAVTCISMLLAAEEEVCRKYILEPLMAPLSKICSGDVTSGCHKKLSSTSEPNSLCEDSESGSCNSDKREEMVNTKRSSEANESTGTVLKISPDKESFQEKNSIPLFDLDHCLSVLDFCFVENDPGMSLPASLLAPSFNTLLREYRDKRLSTNSVSVTSRLLIKFITDCGDDLMLFKALDSALFVGSNSLEGLKEMVERVGSPDIQSEPENLEEVLLKEMMDGDRNMEKLGKVVEEIGATNELGWGSPPLLELVSSEDGGKAAEVVFSYVIQTLTKGSENAGKENKKGDWLVSIAKQSVATQLLCHLLEVPSVNDQVRKNPKDVVRFLGDFLDKEAEKVFKKHKDDSEMEGDHFLSGAVGSGGKKNSQTLLNISSEESFPSFLDLGLNQSATNVTGEGMEEESTKQSHSEFVLVALLILKSLCESPIGNNEQEWWSPFREILPQVRAFRRESSCPEVRAMAEDVACAILTRGKIRTNNGGDRAEEKQPTNFHSKGLQKRADGPEKLSGDFKEKQGRDTTERTIEFEKTLEMVQENAVHLKGHALITLGKLLSSKDSVTLRHQTTLLQIFQDNLKHDDSYIYLAAINGLEKLGCVFPDQVLESLADEFAEIGIVQAGNTAFNDVRLKVGEAILRVTRTLGEMAPKYSCLLLNAFLGGVRDGDGMVRASSLSNLGEVCKILSFRLGSITTEVLWCVRCVLETDRAVEARRAAVLVVTLLLQGMGVEVFKVLETIFPELYRTLKSVRTNDPDEIVQIHAQLALEEVDRITLQFLFPPQRLQKKIFVLDPPS